MRAFGQTGDRFVRVERWHDRMSGMGHVHALRRGLKGRLGVWSVLVWSDAPPPTSPCSRASSSAMLEIHRARLHAPGAAGFGGSPSPAGPLRRDPRPGERWGFSWLPEQLQPAPSDCRPRQRSPARRLQPRSHFGRSSAAHPGLPRARRCNCSGASRTARARRPRRPRSLPGLLRLGISVHAEAEPPRPWPVATLAVVAVRRSGRSAPPRHAAPLLGHACPADGAGGHSAVPILRLALLLAGRRPPRDRSR